MAYCIKCGKQNIDTAKFCTGCGTVLTIAASSQPAPTSPVSFQEVITPASRIKNTWIIIGVGAVLGLSIGAYFIFFNTSAKQKKEEISNVNTTSAPTFDSTAKMVESPPVQTDVPTTGASYIDADGKFVYRSDCFVIITGSFADENYTRGYVNTMKNEGHSNAGYLWIPDYPSLSGKRFYATFIGPYQSYAECESSLRTLKVNSRFWYGIKVSSDPVRVEIRIK